MHRRCAVTMMISLRTKKMATVVQQTTAATRKRRHRRRRRHLIWRASAINPGTKRMHTIEEDRELALEERCALRSNTTPKQPPTSNTGLNKGKE